MGSCVSGPDSVEPIDQISSIPVPSTITPTTAPKTQSHVFIPDPEPNETPEHIADREGGRGQYNRIHVV